MPAINPARLKKQTAALAEHFYKPATFLRELYGLLDFYAERANRPGQAAETQPMIDSYRVRPPVLRQILISLLPLIENDAVAGLVLCDMLWEQPNMECRLLAISILGSIPPVPAQRITQRALVWVEGCKEEKLLLALLRDGLSSLQNENRNALVDLIEDWLGMPNVIYQRLGLLAMRSVADDPAFENLPLLYRLLQPFIRKTPAEVQPDLLAVVTSLARRSPNEVAYLLKVNLEYAYNPDAAWLIRHSYRSFPVEMQPELLQYVRESQRSTRQVLRWFGSK